MWDQFDINVMVNGSRCKQYTHDGKKFVEAKDGSEWYFQIQNNSPGRVLAVCSVDGLNVLTGETATKKDTGYIIDSYHSQKIKGFRFSDDEWALFKFGYKIDKSTNAPNGKVYAVSKGKETAQNCGVIGVRLFYEKFKKVEYVAPPQYNYAQYNYATTCNYAMSASFSCNSYPITGAVSGNVNWSPNNRFNLQNMTEDYFIPVAGAACPDLQAYSGQTLSTDRNSLRDRFNRVRSTSYNCYSNDLKDAIADAKAVRQTCLSTPKSAKPFDMGTEPGRKESSKVETIDFDRGCQAYYVDIYYASRNSLIEMGVPLSNTLKINMPQSFPNKYCKMPDWYTGE